MLNVCLFTKNKIMCQPWLLFYEIFGQSDSEEGDFEGFDVVDGVELINNETVELNEDQWNEIIEEIEAEERNAKYEAYDKISLPCLGHVMLTKIVHHQALFHAFLTLKY